MALERDIADLLANLSRRVYDLERKPQPQPAIAAFGASGNALDEYIGVKEGTNITFSRDPGTGVLIITATGGGGAGASTADAFVTVGHPADLTAERALAAGADLSLVDGGANASVTIAHGAGSSGTNHVTGGNAHDHAGGDGAQLDHGGLAGLADDDHPQYLLAAVPGMKATILLQGWQPTTTGGCADPAKSEVGTTNKHDVYACAFDSASAESAFLHHPMPDNWDGSTVTFRVWWFSKTGYVATSSDGVAWTLKATAYGDGDAIDTAYGTGVTVTDTETANNQARKTADSSALTIGNTPAAGDLVHWVLTRTVSDGADDLAADAYVIGVVVEYGVSALSS